MQWNRKLATTFFVALFLTFTGPWRSSADDTPSGVVNSRDQILGATNQNQNKSDDHDDKDHPCKSKNNPKCKPASKSRPEDDHGHDGGDNHGHDS